MFSVELSVLFFHSFVLFTFVQKYRKYLEELIELITFSMPVYRVEISILELNLFPDSVALNNYRTVTFLQILFLKTLHPFCA